MKRIPSVIRLPLLVLLLQVFGSSLYPQESVPLEIDKEASQILAHVKATGHRFDAVVEEYEIEILWNPERGEVTSVRFEFDFDNVKTGRARRDREMLDWLDYENHPVAVFVLESLEPDDEQFTAKGTLEFHGVEKELEFPVAIRQTDDRVRITAQTEIDYTEWDLERIRAMLLMTVDPVLEIEIDLSVKAP